MAGRGPAPKDPEKRNRRNAEVPMTELDASAAPAKLRALPSSRRRHPRTRRWWKVAAMSPQAALFLETDWLVMERLADLYDAFFGGAASVASEIRLCEAKLGFTAEDRLRLRWRLSEAKRQEEREEEPSVRRGPKSDPRLGVVDGGRS